MDSRIAKRYAGALFNAAKSAKAVAEVGTDLESISDSLRTSSKFREFLLNPDRNRTDKLAVTAKVYGRSHPLTREFLRVSLEKGREEEIEGINEEYKELRRHYEGVIKAVITSAMVLDDSSKQAILAKLKRETGKEIEPEFIVQPDLLGGVKVMFDDFVFDGTVRGSLQKLHERLMRDALKQA
jgi:F-type H+-transporting ATPase subunit delta